MARRNIDINYTEDHVRIPLGMLIGLLGAVALFIVGGFGTWMWFLHQRTDEIPVIRVEIQHIKQSVDRIEVGLGTTPPKTNPNDVAQQ